MVDDMGGGGLECAQMQLRLCVLAGQVASAAVEKGHREHGEGRGGLYTGAARLGCRGVSGAPDSVDHPGTGRLQLQMGDKSDRTSHRSFPELLSN